MEQTKRPALLAGLIITTIEILIFIISHFLTPDPSTLEKVIFWVYIIILFINISSFYTINLSAKEFKVKKYIPWLSFLLIFLYEFYYIAVIIINCKDGIHTMDTLMIANFIIILLGLLLYIPGILKRIIDNKIEYSEHIKKNSAKND